MLLLIFFFLILTFIECNILNVNRLNGGSSSIDKIVNTIKKSNNSNIDSNINTSNKIDTSNNNDKNNVNLTLSAMTWNLAEKKIKVYHTYNNILILLTILLIL